MYLEQLGIYGWNESDENLLLASLLTGDPLLLIGNHGCAKTHLGNKIAQALGKKYLVYDASKAMFEDVLGYPNTAKLQQGVVEYVPSPVTIWDKELILIDELNRAVPELQSKWLEVIRSRRIMGFPTQVNWVWAAMNPVTYSATQTLDEALIGRFAIFLFPPDVLSMPEDERVRVLTHINGDDAPSLSQWTDNRKTAGTVPHVQVEACGRAINELLRAAAKRFLDLRCQLDTLAEFIARFAALLAQETKGQLALDGRRLGFIYRNLLAVRAVELAKAELSGSTLRPFTETARTTMMASIPVGLNDEGMDFETAEHAVAVCFDLLAGYFDEGANLSLVDRVYELLTTHDLMKKAGLLLQADLGAMVKTKVWNDLMNEDRDLGVLAYTALQVEARRPGTVPSELLESLSQHIQPEKLSSRHIPALEHRAVEYIEEIEAMLEQPDDLRRMVAFHHVNRLLRIWEISPETIQSTRETIEQESGALAALLDGAEEKGDAA